MKKKEKKPKAKLSLKMVIIIAVIIGAITSVVCFKVGSNIAGEKKYTNKKEEQKKKEKIKYFIAAYLKTDGTIYADKFEIESDDPVTTSLRILIENREKYENLLDRYECETNECNINEGIDGVYTIIDNDKRIEWKLKEKLNELQVKENNEENQTAFEFKPRTYDSSVSIKNIKELQDNYKKISPIESYNGKKRLTDYSEFDYVYTQNNKTYFVTSDKKEYYAEAFTNDPIEKIILKGGEGGPEGFEIFTKKGFFYDAVYLENGKLKTNKIDTKGILFDDVGTISILNEEFRSVTILVKGEKYYYVDYDYDDDHNVISYEVKLFDAKKYTNDHLIYVYNFDYVNFSFDGTAIGIDWETEKEVGEKVKFEYIITYWSDEPELIIISDNKVYTYSSRGGIKFESEISDLKTDGKTSLEFKTSEGTYKFISPTESE